MDAIRLSVDFLSKKGVESPRLQAELLLAHLLKLPRLNLYLNFERTLTPREQDGLRELIRRRGQREPLQHITGSTFFCGLEIAVNRDVLIPRPETELLAESGWQYLACLKSGAATALDFGTGSGCLAITLAVKCPAARIVAIDISPAALAIARQNAERHQAQDRIQFVESNGFAAVAPSTRFNLIVSNPPYIPAAEITTLDPEVRDHDPRLALDGGADGLDFYRLLARESAPFLAPEGRLMLELGAGQADSVEKLFTEQKWIVEAVKPDYNRIQRILIARRPSE